MCEFALAHPRMGYKRLAWLMVDEDVAYLRPYQVYQILAEHNLLRRRQRPEREELRKPPGPGHPNEIWHVDIMYVRIKGRWYYLVDILDGYSRFLVHWTLNRTMGADTVTLTVQEALERIEEREPGEPKIVHDHGAQFLSAEWRSFVEGVGVEDIFTRVAHPESNGKLERLHRTHREEGLGDEEPDSYYQALELMEGWVYYYNYKRPHSALNYLCPADYYYGDPETRLAEREEKIAQAVVAREAYWQAHSVVKERQDPHIFKGPFSLTSF